MSAHHKSETNTARAPVVTRVRKYTKFERNLTSMIFTSTYKIAVLQTAKIARGEPGPALMTLITSRHFSFVFVLSCPVRAAQIQGAILVFSTLVV